MLNKALLSDKFSAERSVMFFNYDGLQTPLTDHIGWKYHTGKIRTIDEARDVYRLLLKLEQ